MVLHIIITRHNRTYIQYITFTYLMSQGTNTFNNFTLKVCIQMINTNQRDFHRLHGAEHNPQVYYKLQTIVLMEKYLTDY